MSEYLLSFYRPVANALLNNHGLTVPDSTRDNLATSIMQAREIDREPKGGEHSPLPAIRKAATHARALVRYAAQPPSRDSSIGLRCVKLAAALDDPHVALELAIAAPELDQTYFSDGLAAARPDQHCIAMLLDAAKKIEQSGGIVGRPWSIAKPIIRAGCIAWKRAGRVESFTWSSVEGSLSGPLPAFLGDLLACCNGTHALVASMERSTAIEARKRGDGLHLSDDALRALIAECKNAGLF